MEDRTKRVSDAANFGRGRRLRKIAMAGVAAVVALGAVNMGNAQDAASVETAIYRVTPEQYQNIISDVFGRAITLGGRFDPGVRVGGLIAASSKVVSVSASGLEQFDAMARDVASQVVSEKHRASLMSCTPKSEFEPDDACASEFLSEAGRLLLRRPLTEEELNSYVKIAHDSAASSQDFYSGLSTGLSSVLLSPKFLFRREIAVADSSAPSGYRLDSYSKAAKLSFFLWNTGPDAELLAAAEKGDLDTKRGLQKQVDRLLNSQRLENGVRGFFSDFLHFDVFSTLSKDATIYPNFTTDAKRDAQEQTLRTIVDHLLVKQGDYRDLFTTRSTFLTPLLGSVYGVPVVKTTPHAAPEEWTAYEFADSSPQAGILTHASFLSLHSHPGRSSPTLRGKALREVFLCQKVPDPPGNVEFEVIQDTENPVHKTARSRLDAHATEPMCTGCHKITDPLGLALENYDTAANFRQTENGAEIDGSGSLDGASFNDAPSLGRAVHDHPQVPKCLATRAYEYAVGRQVPSSESAWINELVAEFSKNDYRMPALMRSIALSDKFFEPVSPAKGGTQPGGDRT